MRKNTIGFISGRGHLLAAALVLFGTMGLANSAMAASIPLFDTGVDASGTKLPGGAIDPYWEIVGGPGITAATPAVVLSNQHPLGQYFSTADSAWVWASADGSGGVGSPYTFELQLDLTGFDPATATLSGAWGVDNSGSISFNGAPPVGTGIFSIAGGLAFNTPSPFTITGGFVLGINRLDVQVIDDANPGGLNVNGLSGMASPVPEPASALFVLAGLAALAGAVVRRRRYAGPSRARWGSVISDLLARIFGLQSR